MPRAYPRQVLVVSTLSGVVRTTLVLAMQNIRMTYGSEQGLVLINLICNHP